LFPEIDAEFLASFGKILDFLGLFEILRDLR